MKRDKQATMDKQYLDSRSYLDKLGREVLAGEDWAARKFDLWQRANGKCEYFVRCMAEATESHHVIRRSKGRDDRLLNLLALCHYHHGIMEKEGPNRVPRWTKRAK